MKGIKETLNAVYIYVCVCVSGSAKKCVHLQKLVFSNKIQKITIPLYLLSAKILRTCQRNKQYPKRPNSNSHTFRNTL